MVVRLIKENKDKGCRYQFTIPGSKGYSGEYDRVRLHLISTAEYVKEASEVLSDVKKRSFSEERCTKLKDCFSGIKSSAESSLKALGSQECDLKYDLKGVN